VTDNLPNSLIVNILYIISLHVNFGFQHNVGRLLLTLIKYLLKVLQALYESQYKYDKPYLSQLHVHFGI